MLLLLVIVFFVSQLYVCARARARPCVHVCVRARVCACVYLFFSFYVCHFSFCCCDCFFVFIATINSITMTSLKLYR